MKTSAKLTEYDDLERRYADIRDLENAMSILGWDQEVTMPAGGAELRAQTLATLAGVVHERTTEPGLVKLVDRLHRRRADLTPRQRRGLELARRKVHKAAALPERLAREMALAESRGLEQWRRARARGDFQLFTPALSHMVDLKREAAELTAARSGGRKGGRLYDALLDDFEPGATVATIDPLLTRLKEFTVPLVRKVVDSGVKVNLKPLVGRFDVEAQRSFSRDVALAMGIDLERGRMDLSTHPFCGGVGPDDVRMTSRFDKHDLRGGLFGVIHEAGHGLYEQGLNPKRAREPLGGAISMAIHESQSRLWENMVGRSRPFWKSWLPRLRRQHKQLKGVTLDAMWEAANEVSPSLIRVEADELTYNLHIVLRYEIERDLVEGAIAVRDLPQRWNEGMHDLLGVTPPDDGQGVLQDIHWAMGLFGYFPTYSLGNLYAAQFMQTARRELRGLDRRIEKGDLLTLREWLADKIHRHDQVYSADALVKRVTGRPLDTEAFERHISAKVAAIYGKPARGRAPARTRRAAR